MVKPSKTALGKRKAPPAPAKGQQPAKAKAEVGPTGKPKRKPDQPKKVKLRDQKVIPVPQTSFAKQKRDHNDAASDDDDEDFDDEDLGVEEGLDAEFAGSFARGLDPQGLSRTMKETQRLHELSKAREPLPQQARKKSGLPTPEEYSDYDMDLNSDDNFPSDLDDEDLGSEAEGSGTSTLDDDEDLGDGSDLEDQSDLNDAFDDLSDISDDEDEDDDHPQRKKKQKEEEADYETSGRARWNAPAAKPEEDSVEVGRLPIKLPTGEVQTVSGSTRIALPPSKKKPAVVESESEEELEDEEEEDSDDGAQAAKMASKKGRFGRMGVSEIVGMKGVKNAEKLGLAKEQIAQIGAEILAGGELIDIGPVLTRLSTFALPTVPSPEEGQPALPVPNSIRGLAFLSQLAVYKDLVPGYRIRDLTAAEEAEKVRDEVRRLREGEKLLVRSYKGYLKLLESEIKRRTPLASLSLKCMADLLVSATHFNFSENLMGVLVGRVARKIWDDVGAMRKTGASADEQDCEVVLQAFIQVFKQDITAVHSQTLVRLIARMIKERKFQVHPNVLGSLMHLRLRYELQQMRDGKNAKGKGYKGKGKAGEDMVKPKFKSEVRKKWQTKNQKKREREMKEVAKEQAEAEAEVDKEERAQVQTETLKNLFVLYFSILKHPGRTPLVGTALEGISQFTHFINVDFFRDLLAVLRRIVLEEQETTTTAHIHGADEQVEEEVAVDPVGASMRTRTRLLAIVTAFELLSGQGEAINIDLNDFISALFALLRPLSLDTGVEDPPLVTSATSSRPSTRPLQAGRAPPKAAAHTLSTADLLFRSIHAIFFSRHSSSATAPPWRAAAFAKRLSECALFLPPLTAQRAITTVRQLMSKDPKLESMLDTEERRFDGVYKPEMDDPQLCNPFATSLWELEDLSTKHWDRQLRKEAGLLRDGRVI